mgnify:CR=1 FL=1
MDTSHSAPVTVPELFEARAAGRRLAMLTAYDAGFARVLDAAGVDLLLVGDSLGMVVQGHGSTLPVTVDDIAYHTACVARVIRRALLVADLPFQADAQLAGGRLRVLPYLLTGAPETTDAVSAHMEASLLDLGMAQAETALMAQDAFGVRIEHARYLTLHDLLAMTALQYSNQGLEPVWDVLETALLARSSEAWLDAPPEPVLRHVDGEVRMALLTPADWRTRHAPDEQDEALLARGLAMYEARQRQIAAVLQAHGIEVQFVQVAAGQDPADALR